MFLFTLKHVKRLTVALPSILEYAPASQRMHCRILAAPVQHRRKTCWHIMWRCIRYTHTIINMQLHWEIEHSKKQRRLTQSTGNLHHSSGVHKREQAKLILLHLHPSLQAEPHTNGVFQQVILTKACWKRACWTVSACRIDGAPCQIMQCQTQSIRILAQSAHIASVETAV